MEYTILELERIEQALRKKLEEACRAYNAHERKLMTDFRDTWKGSPNKEGSVEFNQHQAEDWGKFKLEDKDLPLLKADQDLFARGLDLIHSHWNSSVETFITNLREQTKAVADIDRIWANLYLALEKKRQEGGKWTVEDIPQIVKNHCEDYMNNQNMKKLTINILAAIKQPT